MKSTICFHTSTWFALYMPTLSGVMRPSAEIATCSVTTNPAPPDAPLRNCCIYALSGMPFCAAQVESGDKTTRLDRLMVRNLKGVNKGGGANRPFAALRVTPGVNKGGGATTDPSLRSG